MRVAAKPLEDRVARKPDAGPVLNGGPKNPISAGPPAIRRKTQFTRRLNGSVATGSLELVAVVQTRCMEPVPSDFRATTALVHALDFQPRRRNGLPPARAVLLD